MTFPCAPPQEIKDVPRGQAGKPFPDLGDDPNPTEPVCANTLIPRGYLADMLTPAQMGLLFKVTGCEEQNKKVNCEFSSRYRTITGKCNNR